MADGSHYLRELTSNDYVAISRSTQTGRVVVESRSGKTYVWESLSQQIRDLTHLSICMAAVAHLGREGIHCPLVIDDVFAHIDEDRVAVVAGVLKRFAESDRQVIATTGWETASARCEAIGIPVRRLASMAMPVVEPRRVVVETTKTVTPELITPAVVEPTVTQPTFGDGIPDDTYYLERTDPIDETPDLEYDDAMSLQARGIDTIGEFLKVTESQLADWSEVTMTSVQMRRLQSMSSLLCDVINLRPYDVRILVGAGIQDATQLRRMTSEQLLSRVEAFVRTTEGRALLVSGDDFELARVANWIRSARESRDFHRETERQQALRQTKARTRSSRSSSRFSVYGSGERSSSGSGSSRSSSSRGSSSRGSSSRSSSSGRGSSTRSSSRSSSSERSSVRGSRSERSSNSRSSESKSKSESIRTDSEWRFYLSRESDVEAAPSIGPKMAEHLAKVGVISVGDLLSGDAEQIAEALDHRRANTETVRLWQRQAEWVCRVPELRGHDAQLLVACGYESVEELAGVDSATLLESVKGVIDTKEGRRILRGGKEPDLAEVNDWLKYSKHSRQLRAA